MEPPDTLKIKKAELKRLCSLFDFFWQTLFSVEKKTKFLPLLLLLPTFYFDLL